MINLAKKGSKTSIDLSKSSAINITASLEWSTQADLDLYGFYVTDNGGVGKVYYKDLGSLIESPYIKLSGDSQSAGKETIQVGNPNKLRYLLIAAYSAVENGVGSFLSYNARVVVSDGASQSVTSSLSEENSRAYWVALALIDFSKINNVKIENVETYSGPNIENSPVLRSDGSFQMDVGPIEFKTQASSGCFIATVCYKNRNDFRLNILREYRDRVLLMSPVGRKIVRIYYRYGGSIAEYIQGNRILENIAKVFVNAFVNIIIAVKKFG